MNQHLLTLALSVCALASGIQTASSEPGAVTLEDLKAIQSKASQTVKKVMPATVSLFSAKNGASGSGVIVNEDGLILTAGHVVRGADEVTVVFQFIQR